MEEELTMDKLSSYIIKADKKSEAAVQLLHFFCQYIVFSTACYSSALQTS